MLRSLDVRMITGSVFDVFECLHLRSVKAVKTRSMRRCDKLFNWTHMLLKSLSCGTGDL